MQRRYFTLALLAGAATSVWGTQSGPVQIGSSADELVAQYMKRFDVPGMSIAFARGKNLLLARGYGWADTSRRIKVTPQSRFRIASNSKALTSASIFKLLEAGRVTLDTPVFAPDGVLPEYSSLGAHRDWIHQITVYHLLTHTAGGWGNERDDPMFEKRGLDQHALIAATLKTHPLEHAPGEHYAYSNFGYCVLGRVIERLSGEPYVRYVRQNLLLPVGVRDMQIGTRQTAPEEVHYYGHDGGDPYDMPMQRLDSHGGWIATPTDMTRWVGGIFSASDDEGQAPLLTAESLAQMTKGTAANPGYACGWATNKAGNCWHTGGLPGTMSLMVHTSTGLSWAANLNTRGRDESASGELDKMMWRIVREMPH
jgi:CubicO group peptidase (beta-lactamase class C family)